MARGKKDLKNAEDSRTYKLVQRRQLSCSICPPNRGENAKRQPKHGAKKPRKKDKRK